LLPCKVPENSGGAIAYKGLVSAWGYARIAIVLVASMAAGAVVASGRITLGLDFLGGARLVYDVQIPASADETVAMDQVVEVARRRLDALGVEDAVCLRRGRSLILEVPGESSMAALREVVPRQGRLRFLRVDERTPIDAIAQLPEAVARSNTGVYSSRARDPLLAVLPSLPVPAGREIMIGRTELGSYQTYVVDPDGLEGHVVDAELVTDEQRGVPQVMITFDDDGRRIFDSFTARIIDQKLAITLDGEVYSAPVVRTRIPGGRAVIDLGGHESADAMTQAAMDLVIVLRAGALPAPLILESESTISAGISNAQRNQGLIAIALALLIIAIAAFVRYRVAGLSIALGVPLTVVMSLAMFVAFDGVFTLMSVIGIATACACMILSSVNVLEWKSKLNWMVSAGLLGLVLAIGLALVPFGIGPTRGVAFGLVAGLLGAATTTLLGTTALAQLRRR
jgi:preprotein translocase subunit SecD